MRARAQAHDIGVTTVAGSSHGHGHCAWRVASRCGSVVYWIDDADDVRLAERGRPPRRVLSAGKGRRRMGRLLSNGLKVKLPEV